MNISCEFKKLKIVNFRNTDKTYGYFITDKFGHECLSKSFEFKEISLQFDKETDFESKEEAADHLKAYGRYLKLEKL